MQLFRRGMHTATFNGWLAKCSRQETGLPIFIRTIIWRLGIPQDSVWELYRHRLLSRNPDAHMGSFDSDLVGSKVDTDDHLVNRR